MKNIVLTFLLVIFCFSCAEKTKKEENLEEKLITSKNIALENHKDEEALSVSEKPSNVFLLGKSKNDFLFYCESMSYLSIGDFDIKKIKEVNLKKLKKDYNSFFSDKCNKPVNEVFYMQSIESSLCNGIFYIIYEDEMTSLKMFYFDEKGSYINNLILTGIYDDTAGLYSEYKSTFKDEDKTLIQLKVNNMIDAYVDENNYSEIIDSIKTVYSLRDKKLIKIKSDSIRSTKTFNQK
ncbi:hypothetical protein [Winogradskyella sp. 4-2091]|uniref:hypothetical protein n=1 Tax=Winogradskyella sp. 4-2091 TaxID=3381659 RepID=UPI00389282F4